jgi:hypothetical protein
MGDSSITHFLPPRDSAGPVTCAVCGCRLTPASGSEDGAWRHFPSLMAGHDARGCRPHCVDALHGRDGRPLRIDEAQTADESAGAAAA